MTSRSDAERLRGQLIELLVEDSRNARRLSERLEALSKESGVNAYAAILLVLTRHAFGPDEAKRHWDEIVAHQAALSVDLGRDVAVRVAALDYFINLNRNAVRPVGIELSLLADEEGPSARDTLTGLLTDREFRVALQAEIRRARRYGQRVAVALFDLDGFRAVNASVGELLADRLLRDAAILLRNKIRDIDLAARLGQDELAVILPQTDRNGAVLVAERYRVELERHFAHREVGGKRVAITVSGGVAAHPVDADTAESLLERSAQALYAAKATGKNIVRTYHPQWRRFLRVDLTAGRFEVEVLAPRELDAGRALRLGRTGIVFGSPEPLQVGEEIEIRLIHAGAEPGAGSPRLRGQVVRLEALPIDPEAEEADVAADALPDRFEIGMAFDREWGPDDHELLEFFESSPAPSPGAPR